MVLFSLSGRMKNANRKFSWLRNLKSVCALHSARFSHLTSHKAARRARSQQRRARLTLERLEVRELLSTLLVTSVADSGAGTLRQAILDANANPGLDTIDFNIPGSGVQTIAPNSPLPTITDPVFIDGYSQPGSSPNTLTTGDNAVLRIELNGANAGFDTHGLVLESTNSTVRGLVINQFGFFGIVFSGPGATGNQIEGNFIGTDPTGMTPLGNRDGMFFAGGANNNLLGGTTPDARNILAGNRLTGVGIADPGSDNNQVQGNYIGTNAAGTAAIPNGRDAVIIFSNSLNNLIGGTTAGAGNVLSGNNRWGVAIGTTGNVVQGNYIGTNAAGNAALGNALEGVRIDGSFNTIGGITPGAGNTIAFNGSYGVSVVSGTGTSIRGNSIYANHGLGINIPGGSQSYPVLVDATSGPTTAVSFSLNSLASTTYAVDFYANTVPDPSGYGQGQRYLGSTTVMTDASGNASSVVVLNAPTSAGEYISATATAPDGTTSPFAADRQARGFSMSVPATIPAGAPFTFTLTALDPFSDSSPYTGTVHFASTDGAATLPGDYTFTAADAGTHTFTATLATVGSQTITATDTSTSSLTVSATVTVSPQTTTVGTASANPSNFGQALTFTATVTPNPPYSGTPTGTLDFFDTTTATDLGSVSLSSGSASLTTTTLPVGSQTITLSYSGDANFLASSGTVTVTIVPSIYVLDPTLGAALGLTGGASINIPGLVQVDSSSSRALAARGSAQVQAGNIQVVGGFLTQDQATFSPAPVTGVASVPDPLAGLPAPAPSVGQPSVTLTAGSLTINPGMYIQIQVSGTGSLTLNPGVYIVGGGGFTVTQSASVSGTGVMIYNAGSNFFGSGTSLGAITLTGQGGINLTPASAGPYAGIVIFQSPDNPRDISLSAQAALGLANSLIYAPAALLTVSGNALIENSFVVDRLLLGVAGARSLMTAAPANSTEDTPGELPEAASPLGASQALLGASASSRSLAGSGPATSFAEPSAAQKRRVEALLVLTAGQPADAGLSEVLARSASLTAKRIHQSRLVDNLFALSDVSFEK